MEVSGENEYFIFFDKMIMLRMIRNILWKRAQKPWQRKH